MKSVAAGLAAVTLLTACGGASRTGGDGTVEPGQPVNARAGTLASIATCLRGAGMSVEESTTSVAESSSFAEAGVTEQDLAWDPGDQDATGVALIASRDAPSAHVFLTTIANHGPRDAHRVGTVTWYPAGDDGMPRLVRAVQRCVGPDEESVPPLPA